MRTANKKAQMGLTSLGPIAVALIVGVVSLVLAAKVSNDLYNSFKYPAGALENASSMAMNASQQSINMFANLTNQLPLLGTIIGLGLVIGVLVASFMYFRR